METWPSVFSFWLVGWVAGWGFCACLHFTIFYMSAKYAEFFDGDKK